MQRLIRDLIWWVFLVTVPPLWVESAHSAAVENSLGGRVYTDQFFSVARDPDHALLQSSFSAWLEYKAKFSPHFSFHIIGQGDLFYHRLTEPNHPSSTGKIREAYFAYQDETVEFRLGQQIIPWGKSDIINPTDYFTAKDYTYLNSDEEVRRKGAPALLVSVTPEHGTSPINITGVMQFAHPTNTLYIPPAVKLYPGLGLQKYADDPEWFKEQNMEYGVKVSYLKNTFDLSLSAFRGMNHSAQYIYRAGMTTVTPEYIRETAVGADASINTGDLVIRAESAYIVPDQGNQGSALYGLTQPNHWDTTAGVEHTFFDDFQTQIQVLYRHHYHFADANHYSNFNPIVTTIQRGVAAANALLLNYQRADNVGATFRIGYQNEASKWKADLFLVGYFSQGQDYVIRPQVTYKMIEGWRVLAGGDFYGGQEDRPLGALKVNNSVFFESIYTF